MRIRKATRSKLHSPPQPHVHYDTSKLMDKDTIISIAANTTALGVSPAQLSHLGDTPRSPSVKPSSPGWYYHTTARDHLFFPGSILWLPRFEHIPDELQELRSIQHLRPGTYSHPFMVLEKPRDTDRLVKALIVTTFSHGGPPKVGERTRYRCEIEDFLPIAPTLPDPEVRRSFQLQLGSPHLAEHDIEGVCIDTRLPQHVPKLERKSWINVVDIFEIPREWLGELFTEPLKISAASFKRLRDYRAERLHRLRLRHLSQSNKDNSDEEICGEPPVVIERPRIAGDLSGIISRLREQLQGANVDGDLHKWPRRSF